MTIYIPPFVRCVMEALDLGGYRAYLVGGSLRDMLRGEVPHDFDLTTDATPDEMIEVLSQKFRVIPTGVAHGTVTVMSEGNPIEITTHRVDGAYRDARHPEAVTFTRALQEDLSRRDFTINAMAYHPEVGLVDLFSGREDLSRGVIRAVGDPETRFREDALRILRAFRFSAKLCFVVDEATLAGAKRAKEGLAQISVERIFAELCGLLEAQNADKGLDALLECDCGKYVFFDTVSALNKVSIQSLPPVAALRMAALFPTLTREEAMALSRRYHAPNAFGLALGAFCEGAREALPTNDYEARKYLLRYWHHFRGCLALAALRGDDVSSATALCERASRDGSVVEIRRLAVNGKELQVALGVRPEKTGELLARLQDAVLQTPESNKKNHLLALAAKICEKEREFLD